MQLDMGCGRRRRAPLPLLVAALAAAAAAAQGDGSTSPLPPPGDPAGGGGASDAVIVSADEEAPAMHWFPDGWLPYGKSCKDADPATRRLPLEALRFDSWAPASVLSPAPRQLLVVGLVQYAPGTGSFEGRNDVLWSGDAGRSWFCVSPHGGGGAPPQLATPGGSAWLVDTGNGGSSGACSGSPSSLSLCVSAGRAGIVSGNRTRYITPSSAVLCARLVPPQAPGGAPPQLEWVREPEPLPATALAPAVVNVPLSAPSQPSAVPAAAAPTLTLLVGGIRRLVPGPYPELSDVGANALWLMTVGAAAAPPSDGGNATAAAAAAGQACPPPPGEPLGLRWLPLPVNHSGATRALTVKRPLAAWLPPPPPAAPADGGGGDPQQQLQLQLGGVLLAGGHATLDGSDPLSTVNADAINPATGGPWTDAPLIDALMVPLPVVPASAPPSPTPSASASVSPSPSEAATAVDGGGGSAAIVPLSSSSGSGSSLRQLRGGAAQRARRAQVASVGDGAGAAAAVAAALANLSAPLRSARHALQLPRTRPTDPLGAAYSLALLPAGAPSDRAFYGGVLLPDSSWAPTLGPDGHPQPPLAEQQREWCAAPGKCAAAVLAAGADVYVGAASAPAAGLGRLSRVGRHVLHLVGIGDIAGGAARVGEGDAGGSGAHCAVVGAKRLCVNATDEEPTVTLPSAPGDAVGLHLWHQQDFTLESALADVVRVLDVGGWDAADAAAAGYATRPFGHLLVADAATGQLWRGTFTACYPLMPCPTGQYTAGCGVGGPLAVRCVPCPPDSHASQCTLNPFPTNDDEEGGGGFPVVDVDAGGARPARLTGALSTHAALAAWIALACEAIAGGAALLLLLAAAAGSPSAGGSGRGESGKSSAKAAAAGAAAAAATGTATTVRLPPSLAVAAELLVALVAATAAAPFVGARDGGYGDVAAVTAAVGACLAARPALALAGWLRWALPAAQRHSNTAGSGSDPLPPSAGGGGRCDGGSGTIGVLAACALRPVALRIAHADSGGGAGAHTTRDRSVRQQRAAGQRLLPPAAYAALSDVPLALLLAVLVAWATAVPSSPAATDRVATAGLAWVALLAQAALAARTVVAAVWGDDGGCAARGGRLRRRGGHVSPWETQPALVAGAAATVETGEPAAVYRGAGAAAADGGAAAAAAAAEASSRAVAGGDVVRSDNPLQQQLRRRQHQHQQAATTPTAVPGGGRGLLPTADGLWRLAATEEGARLADQVIFFRAYPQLVLAAAEAVASDPLPAPWVRLLQRLEGGRHGGGSDGGPTAAAARTADENASSGGSSRVDSGGGSPALPGDNDDSGVNAAALYHSAAATVATMAAAGEQEGGDVAAGAAAELLRALGLPPPEARHAGAVDAGLDGDDDGGNDDDDDDDEDGGGGDDDDVAAGAGET